ncbi:uncharacterized protein B0I36DRAFT_20422 [Microdochium trichocladiopsis]|uniref:Killer toxin Kp4 domain-containing protein n=1 Tax=Microdochium trichocladiopsis TaxID=1682393 RepID=A0A9P8YJT9_9PEZI|nr:uncharacterized protein B0I36DRAFT_20422 [Microdochium trichocladiopsis]KAH7041193.1 hypothetical protein B0I36DRAFT_20422 [Microdochium trichocladiopsis]
MKTTSILAFFPISMALAAPSPLSQRQTNGCVVLSGGPNDEARAAVVEAMKSHLPLDVGGDDGWSGSGGPTFCMTCQSAKIWIQHAGWEGAGRSITAEQLDAVMDTFNSGGRECGNSVDGSGGYLSVLYGNDYDYSGTCDFEWTC